MAETTEITMDTDWGAPGAQLTGAQVQAFIKSQFKALIKQTELLEQRLSGSECGCYIAYYSTNGVNNGMKQLATYDKWPEIAASAKPIGVVVLSETLQPLLISLSNLSGHWGEDLQPIHTLIETSSAAVVAMNGKNTTHSLQNSDKLTSDANSAISLCLKYSKVETINGKDYGVPAGDWWLPSVGELMIMLKYRDAINRCLSVIAGANVFGYGNFCSSNEYSATEIWALTLFNGNLYIADKRSGFSIRPVSRWF